MSKQTERTKILEEIAPIIANKAGCDVSEVTMNAKFEELGADSLDSIEAFMEIERFYKMSIPDKVQEKINTVDKLVTAIINYRIDKTAVLWLAVTKTKNANTAVMNNKFKTITK